MDISILKGKTLSSVIRGEMYGNDALFFTTVSGEKFMMYHFQSCCESVYLEDIVGDLSDLIYTPILSAEEVTQDLDVKYGDQMFTFYHIRTLKGTVTLRWNGSSNGYY